MARMNWIMRIASINQDPGCRSPVVLRLGRAMLESQVSVCCLLSAGILVGKQDGPGSSAPGGEHGISLCPGETGGTAETGAP